jgi:Ca2+-binding EF-hand superfamily protein
MTLHAVYEMVGTPADKSKADELFSKLDENSDGEISQEEFINIIKQNRELLNFLQKKS